MAPPQNRQFEGIQHPDNCLFVCFGHKTHVVTASNGTFLDVNTWNIWAYKDRAHGDKITFCIEQYTSGGTDEQGRWAGAKLGEHSVMGEAEYLAVHAQLWHEFDMEPNRDFNVGEGLRGVYGEHLSGSNKLTESNGALKMQAIRENCP